MIRHFPISMRPDCTIFGYVYLPKYSSIHKNVRYYLKANSLLYKNQFSPNPARSSLGWLLMLENGIFLGANIVDYATGLGEGAFFGGGLVITPCTCVPWVRCSQTNCAQMGKKKSNLFSLTIESRSMGKLEVLDENCP